MLALLLLLQPTDRLAASVACSLSCKHAHDEDLEHALPVRDIHHRWQH
jgi:hypothetical protein